VDGPAANIALRYQYRRPPHRQFNGRKKTGPKAGFSSDEVITSLLEQQQPKRHQQQPMQPKRQPKQPKRQRQQQLAMLEQRLRQQLELRLEQQQARLHQQQERLEQLPELLLFSSKQPG
jgi:exonuclease VII large subunit